MAAIKKSRMAKMQLAITILTVFPITTPEVLNLGVILALFGVS